MKKFFLFAVLLISATAMAQAPVMTFEKATHDFGQISETGGRVTTVFKFKNESAAPLVLNDVRASCGCTTPKWPREPIMPGATGEITVTYNPSGRPGRFQKTITVTSNASEPTIRLYIKGEVVPKPVVPTEQYPAKIGPLNFKKTTLNFGAMRQGQVKTLEIPYTNLTKEVVTLDVYLSNDVQYIKPLVTVREIKPNETGKIQITLTSAECTTFGPMNVKLYLEFNGIHDRSDANAIILSHDIKEDFSKMTVEEIQQAPIAEIAKDINLGEIQAGKKFQTKINLSNAGINPLVVRRVLANDPNIAVTASKSSIKNGHKTTIPVTIDASKMPAAQYTRIVTVITNDPKAAVIQVRLNWTVK